MESFRQSAAHAGSGRRFVHGTTVHAGPIQRLIYIPLQQELICLRHAHRLQKHIRLKTKQYVAHVKHNVAIHQTIFTFPLVALNTMAREIMVLTVSMVARAAAVPSLIRTTS